MIIKHRSYSILFISLLMASAIFITNISFLATQDEPDLDIKTTAQTPSLPTEKGVFERSEYALHYSSEGEGTRTLSEYYENRAYPGAPPIIPHPLLSEKGIGGNSCLQCHQNGGYVAQFDAFAPITPHPDLKSCRQCHVPSKTKFNFKGTDWKKIAHPNTNNRAMAGSPPVIPHGLQMRENCLSCHAGPAAPREIKVSHPERLNCRQCHASVNSLETILWDTLQWTRGKPTFKPNSNQ